MEIRVADRIRMEDKPKVLFIAPPTDDEEYFETIADDILTVINCAVYNYHNDRLFVEDWASILTEMNLLVFPVTNTILSRHSLKKIIDDARDKKMPLLPIMVERNLENTFNSIFEDIQFLDRTEDDPTSIPYKQKLRDYLSSVLYSNDTVQKVRSAFDTSLFLSYRRKDRRHALKLMRRIHSLNCAWDVAIWYDEFLTPGENYNEEISLAIKKSDFFVLAVTRNIGLDNNYVIREEYPTAITARKPILPVEIEPTDISNLKGSYDGLPDCVNIDDETALIKAIEACKPRATSSRVSDTRLRTYYIGLGFLYGIQVEIDREKGISLLSSAAEDGVVEAANDLAGIYVNGVFVSRNYRMAEYWQRKVVILLEQQYDSSKTTDHALDLAEAYIFLSSIMYESTDSHNNCEELLACCENALELCDHAVLLEEQQNNRYIECKLNALRLIGIVLENANDYKTALSVYSQALRLRATIKEFDEDENDSLTDTLNQVKIAQLQFDMGILNQKLGEYGRAISYFTTSLSVYEAVFENVSSVFPTLIRVHSAIADSSRYVDVFLAEKHSRIALKLSEALCAEDQVQYQLLYANCLLNRATVLSDLDNVDDNEIIKMLQAAIAIYQEKQSDDSYEITFNLTNARYKLASVFRNKYSLKEARAYYESAIEASVTLVDCADSADKLTLGSLFFDYATFLAIEATRKKLEKALESLQIAFSLFKTTGEKGEVYLLETRRVMQSIRKSLSNEAVIGLQGGEDVEKTFYAFQSFLATGDKAESDSRFGQAQYAYQEALKQLSLLEQSGEKIDALAKADLYDRLAYCYEMNQENSLAEHFYIKAFETAFEEAKLTQSETALKTSISGLEKVISFLSDLGKNKEALAYRQLYSAIQDLPPAD